MGWINRLCQTYDNMQGTDAFTEAGHPLVPAGFIEKKAAIHVALTSPAHSPAPSAIKRARKLRSSPPPRPKRALDQRPSPSAVRAASVWRAIFSEGANQYFDSYAVKLSDWVRSADAPPKLKLLRDYLAQRRLIRDMLDSGFPLDAEGTRRASSASRSRAMRPRRRPSAARGRAGELAELPRRAHGEKACATWRARRCPLENHRSCWATPS
jgi:hypothetical protein